MGDTRFVVHPESLGSRASYKAYLAGDILWRCGRRRNLQLPVLGLRLAALGIWDGFQGGHGPALLLWVANLWNVHSNARHGTWLWRCVAFCILVL